jgi:hypothetical protein
MIDNRVVLNMDRDLFRKHGLAHHTVRGSRNMSQPPDAGNENVPRRESWARIDPQLLARKAQATSARCHVSEETLLGPRARDRRLHGRTPHSSPGAAGTCTCGQRPRAKGLEMPQHALYIASRGLE